MQNQYYFRSYKNNLLNIHSDTLLLVAVSDACLGIDAERLDRTLRNSDSIVNKYFSVGEKNLYNKAYSDDKKQVFLDIWVKKEAMVKFTGKGLSELKNTDSCHAEGVFINIPYKLKEPRTRDYKLKFAAPEQIEQIAKITAELVKKEQK